MQLLRPTNLPFLPTELQQLVDTVLSAAALQDEEELSPELQAAFNSIYKLEAAQQHAALQVLAGRIDEVAAPIGTGFIYVFIGSIVESGLNPELTLPYLFNHFVHRLEQIPRVANKEELDDDAYDAALEALPEIAGELAYGLQLMGQGLVAHLARTAYLRQSLAENAGLLELLEDTESSSVGISWVKHVLQQVSNDLLIIHAEEKVGVRVHYENITNCFHLFTLLQAALVDNMPSVKVLNELAVRVAKHLSSGDAHDEAWLHYGSCFSNEANIMLSVWGEMSPRHLDRLDGQQIILLWTPILSCRIWDSGFYYPFIEACPPKLELLETLSAEQVQFWLDKVAELSKNQVTSTEQ